MMPMLPTAETANLSVLVHPNGVEEYIFSNTSRAAVDDLIAYLDQLYLRTPKGAMVLQLFDSQVGFGSIAYAMQAAKALLKRHPQRPRTRTAILYKDHLALTWFAPSLRLLPGFDFVIRLFKGEDRDKAVTWLLSDHPR
jgi:hypothetical protein